MEVAPKMPFHKVRETTPQILCHGAREAVPWRSKDAKDEDNNRRHGSNNYCLIGFLLCDGNT